MSKGDLRKEADKHIRKEQIFIAADKESYEIGYVAGLILDEKDPNWKETFYVTGKGIPEVLLENRTPISDEPDKEIVDRVAREIDRTNKDGILTIDSDHLKADGIQVKTSEEDGRTIYSAEIQD